MLILKNLENAVKYMVHIVKVVYLFTNLFFLSDEESICDSSGLDENVKKNFDITLFSLRKGLRQRVN